MSETERAILEMIRDLSSALQRQGTDLDGNWGHEPCGAVFVRVGREAHRLLQAPGK